MDAQGRTCAIQSIKIVVTSFLFQYWENCRWTDPSEDRDLERMTAELQRAHAIHEKLHGCTVERLCEALSIARDSPQTEASDIEDDIVPMCGERRERVGWRMGVVDSSVIDSQEQDGYYKQLVQVLIPVTYGQR